VTQLEENLSRLVGRRILSVSDSGYYQDNGEASIAISFSDGTTLRADYWRLFEDGTARLSGFDHRQQYGLPAPINAVAELRKALDGSQVTKVELDYESGDLVFCFDQSRKLQVLNFTGYEIWQITFPDGTVSYSNFVLTDIHRESD